MKPKINKENKICQCSLTVQALLDFEIQKNKTESY
jgi:hypothetical protein